MVLTSPATTSSKRDGIGRRRPANVFQSTGTIAALAMSSRSNRSNARMPRSGAIQPIPDAASRAAIRSRCASASPSPDHAPQAIAWPASPSDRRCRAS